MASRPSRFEPLWQPEIHLLPIVAFQRQLHDCERGQVDSREATLNKAPFSTSKKTRRLSSCGLPLWVVLFYISSLFASVIIVGQRWLVQSEELMESSLMKVHTVEGNQRPCHG